MEQVRRADHLLELAGGLPAGVQLGNAATAVAGGGWRRRWVHVALPPTEAQTASEGTTGGRRSITAVLENFLVLEVAGR